ncbi:hypothetical protein V2W45_1337275 [Cenococcum geophilum]
MATPLNFQQHSQQYCPFKFSPTTSSEPITSFNIRFKAKLISSTQPILLTLPLFIIADLVTPKNKSIQYKVPPTPAIGEAVVKILRGMSKLLKGFYDNLGGAVEEDKAKDGGEAEAKAEDRGEAAAEEEAERLDKAEDITTVSKLRKKGLLPIKFNLSKAVNIAYITGARDEFFAVVRLLKFNALTNNKKTVIRVTKDDAIKITNFFFSQIMGKLVLSRLSLLIQLYNKHDDHELDKEVAERAQEAARRTINYTLKHFFETVKKSKIYIICIYIELTDAYIKLIKEAICTSKATKEEKAKKKALKTELRLKGCPTAKGKGLKSAMIQYIYRELVIERNILDYRTQCGKSVKSLVD